MKVSAITYVIITSLILLTVAIFAALNFPFNLIFYLTMIGEVVFIFTVFRVLRDPYHTEKTFKDFYEDHPIGNEYGATREVPKKERFGDR